MLLWHVAALAFLQGLTEFLPISSSAHLILLPSLSGWDDQGIAFDVAVHVGTLSAVVLYFRHELVVMSGDWLYSLRTRQQRGDSRLAWGVLLGTIPVGLGGLLLSAMDPEWLRSPMVIAITTILFGLLLWWADYAGKRGRDEHSLSLKDILIIGVAQALALIPGTSRSGITITAGLLLGLTREAAARFSFLLSIPVIVLAGGLEAYKGITRQVQVDWSAAVTGTVLAGVSAYLCIHFFLKLLDRVGMVPFVIYRLILGVVLLAIYL